MTDLFFRAIVPDEVDDFFASLAIAFSDPRPDAEEVETDKKVIEVDRTFAAFDGDRIVGCAGVYSQRMVVAGGARVPTAGGGRGGGPPPPPRRAAPAPRARDPPRTDGDDARPGGRARRADGVAVRIAGRDLRPLRIRARGSPPGVRRRARSPHVGGRERADRTDRAPSAARGAPDHASDLRPRDRRPAGRPRGGRPLDGRRVLGVQEGRRAGVLRGP